MYAPVSSFRAGPSANKPRLDTIINSLPTYQARSHHKANIDPLGIRGSSNGFGNVKPIELTLEYYNFSEKGLVFGSDFAQPGDSITSTQ